MTKSFFTVAIGASAGGLSPLIDFFDHIPININCAFVVITHLKRDHRSSLDELLSKHTSLPLIRMEKDMQLEVGNIYLLIENTAVKITNGYLKVEARDDKVANSSVNIFFKSLADDCGEMGIGIILSGGGYDGLEGAKRINERGGKWYKTQVRPKYKECHYQSSISIIL